MAVSLLDTSIFERSRSGEEARRAHRLEHIYHVGQDKIWDGREVLSSLQAKYGRPNLPPEKQRALVKVFAGLMWGEFAAWKISAQLADALTDFEAKMAATSQVHDEARHFYVFHDYLEWLGCGIPSLNRPTRALLETVLATDDLVMKLIGMQLFVESMALTVFKAVRELAIEPVLADLLSFFERDEARHVGLGVQHTPSLVKNLGRRHRMRLDAYQAKLLFLALMSLKSLETDFRELGIDPRRVADAGKEKMVATMKLLAEVNGEQVLEVAGPLVQRVFDATRELLFPPIGVADSIRGRVKEAALTFTRPIVVV